MPKLPLSMFAIVFIVLMTLTQFMAYQRYKISRQQRTNELIHEASAAKDRFRNILFNDLAAANTLAIIYKQFGVPDKFDSTAGQILKNSRYAQALQITENGIVKNVYPDSLYKSTIGTNVNADPVRNAEEMRAVIHKDIYFAGPRRLRFGDTGILGKVPILVNNQVKAVATVLTRLPLIRKALEPASADKAKFAYQLLKVQSKDTLSFALSNTKPGRNSEYISIGVPEGDWLLRVSYTDGYVADKFSYELSGFGVLLAFIAGLAAYREALEPDKLNKIIDEKTDQLAKSEKYFRTLIETSSDAIVLLDREGKVLYQTPSAEKILDYNLSEMHEIDGLELIHPDDQEDDNKMFGELISSPGAFVHRKHRIKHKNGNYIHIEGTYRNLLHDENVKAIVYNYKDVTEKALSEQNLLESETRFRRAFEDSAIGMGLVSLEGRWIKVNRTLYEMLGYTEEELLSLTFQQITHPDDLEKDLELLSQTLRGEIDTYRIEKRYFHKNGGIIWINLNVSIIRDADKQPMYFVSQVENVTDKVLSEQNLARSNRELTLLNKISDIILRVDDELQLYREVCECLTTAGNYELAWICHKPDTNAADQTVVPLVAFGATEYLTDAGIVLNDAQRSNGPTAIALNTGKIVVNNDVANSTYFGQFIKNASLFGVGSSIALPLNLGHNKSGALAMYAGQANGFDENEVSTLTRLAASLSLAIQHIRNREELIESENRFRGAFEDSAIGMGITSIEENSKGQWIKVNQPLCEMLGYTEDELLSLTFMQVTHPDDVARDLAAQDQTIRGELGTYTWEKRYIHKDGSIVWINLNVSLIKDKDKRPLYLFAQVENITGKIESQTQFQNLVERFVVGVYIIQNNKLVYVNPRVIEDTGYAEDEIIGMPFDKFIYPDDLELLGGIVDARTNDNLKTIRYEVRIKQKNGQPLWYEILAGSTSYRGAPALIGTMVSITERKAVYDELERSEAKLKSIFDTTDVSYLLLDKNYNIVALNQHMKDAYIAAAGIVLYEGADLMELMPREKQETARAAYDKVIKDNNALDYETTYTRDGVTTHFLANVKPINDGKKVIGICISSIDITERKNALEQLKQLNENLQEQTRELAISNAELEQFAYVASHDLQEPLRMVTSFLTQLEKKYSGVLDEKAKQYIYFATDGAKRMRLLILDLLEYSRVGRTEDDLEEVDFNKLINEMLGLYRRKIEELKAKILFENLPVFRTYRTPLRQVFQNLIDNSLKYCKPNEAPLIRISAKETETHYQFSVRDNGIGISPEYFDKIFIIFQRLHNKDEYSGTGMGLAVTKKVIENLGGKIWLESEEGKGTTFYFTILKDHKS